MLLNVFNQGEKIGCVVEIKNKGGVALEQLEWMIDSDNNRRQYSRWLYGTTKLEPDRLFIVDSRPLTFRAEIEYLDNPPFNAVNFQDPNPQYINFVNIWSGDNRFIFNLGPIDDVEVTVSYSEQRRIMD